MQYSQFDMIVEIPLNSFVKYEFDKKCNNIRCDRILHTAMAYPGNYGYFPNTLSGDGGEDQCGIGTIGPCRDGKDGRPDDFCCPGHTCAAVTAVCLCQP